jgi:ABC-2 type transport system permease protein
VARIKFFPLVAVQFSSALVYRINWFFGILMDFLRISMYWIFWSAAMAKQDVGRYDLAAMVEYYVMALVFNRILSSDVGYGISDDIYSGRLSFHLIRPYPYCLAKTAQDLSGRIGNFLQALLSLALFLIIMIALGSRARLSVNPPALLVLFNAAILTYLVSYLIGLTGYWTHTVWAVFLVYEILFNVFGGMLFPLDIVPGFLRPFFTCSPFYYMLFYPVSLFMNGGAGFSFYSPLIQCGWIGAVLLLCFLLNTTGRKRFEGVGL